MSIQDKIKHQFLNKNSHLWKLIYVALLYYFTQRLPNTAGSPAYYFVWFLFAFVSITQFFQKLIESLYYRLIIVLLIGIGGYLGISEISAHSKSSVGMGWVSYSLLIFGYLILGFCIIWGRKNKVTK